MTMLTIRQAAARLQAADKVQPDRNGLDLFIAASGGYGKAKQHQLLEDIRTVYAYVLGTRGFVDIFPPRPDPSDGFDAA